MACWEIRVLGYLCAVMTPYRSVAAIIPARWASSRFPGKPIAPIGGRPMVLHVIDRCQEAGVGRVILATDDERIARVGKDAGVEVAMTDPALPSGTDRCAAVAASLDSDWIINVQGDEPFVDSGAIRQLSDMLIRSDGSVIATLARPARDPDQLDSMHSVKVVTDLQDRALYFSRMIIPAQRDRIRKEWISGYPYLLHIGMYGFSKSTLLTLAGLPVTDLEQAEQLEQLRWMDHGYRIVVGRTRYEGWGIDTPEDLALANQKWNQGEMPFIKNHP